MINPQRKKHLEEFEKKIGATFLNPSLLNQSLTHSSYVHEQGKKEIFDNERLEFLGDAVLKLVISEYLHNRFPDHAEGELTKIRATVVSDTVLADAAKKLRIGEYLLLSRNEHRSGGTTRKSNIANAMEALFAAIYLDQGIGKARDIILGFLKHDLDRVSQQGYIDDWKSALQEHAQKNKWGLPHYHVAKEVGPKHNRIFFINVKVDNRIMGHGRGQSKKEAQQEAAKMALDKLTGRPRRPFLLSLIQRDKK